MAPLATGWYRSVESRRLKVGGTAVTAMPGSITRSL